MKRLPIIAIAVFAFGALSACSALKDYPNNLPQNAVITSKPGSGMEASVNIYEVKGHCKYNYLGTLQLKNGDSLAGIPTNKLIRLDFQFTYSSWLSSGDSSTFSAVFASKPRARYKIYASYIDNMYDIRIKKKGYGQHSWHNVDSVPLDGCSE